VFENNLCHFLVRATRESHVSSLIGAQRDSPSGKRKISWEFERPALVQYTSRMSGSRRPAFSGSSVSATSIVSRFWMKDGLVLVHRCVLDWLAFDCLVVFRKCKPQSNLRVKCNNILASIYTYIYKHWTMSLFGIAPSPSSACMLSAKKIDFGRLTNKQNCNTF